MEKTALNLAIEIVQRDERGMLHAYDKQIVSAILTSLLPTEQHQIEAAYKDGLTMGHVTGETALKSASDYFTTKYTTI